MTVSPLPPVDKEYVQSSQKTYDVFVKAAFYGTGTAIAILVVMALTLL